MEAARARLTGPHTGKNRTMSTHTTAAAGVQVCSLKRDTPQTVPANSPYTVIRFPFGSAESSDRFTMHQANQPDGYVITDWDNDPRSGLIWPSVVWLGHPVRDDPVGGRKLRRTPRPVRPRPPRPHPQPQRHHGHGTPPAQPRHAVLDEELGHLRRPGRPLAVRATHDDSVARDIVLAEFKLVIHEAA